MRFGPSPVFAYECLTASRRWQNYAARSFGLAALLVAMGTIAASRHAVFEGRSVREYFELGRSYFPAIVGVELALVMLAAPAATAGAICLDRSRGTLEHMLTTDLSDAEIVLGKLGARLLPVIGLIVCSFPVLAISTLLGGIDLFALTVAYAVVLAVALLGCSLALALSVWARKPHEVVLAMYTVWALALIAHPLWQGMSRRYAFPPPPDWVVLANPFTTALLPDRDPVAVATPEYLGFFAATLGCSALLILVTIRSVRPAAMQGPGRRAAIGGRGVLNRIVRRLPGPSIDRNPVLWREWHRSRSPRLTALLILLVGLTIVACASQAFLIWTIGVERGGGDFTDFGGVYSYLLPLIFGLLILAAAAPMSLSEERQRGSLDVLMATPLSTRTIVVGKWLSVFRMVPWLAIGPGLMGLALAGSPVLLHLRGQPDPPVTPAERLTACGLLMATLLAHGAAMTSLGLWLATWVHRQSRAIGISVTLFVLLSFAWPAVMVMASNPAFAPYPGAGSQLSPVFAVACIIEQLSSLGPWFRNMMIEVAGWTIVATLAAILLLEWTVRSFDRHLGRMSSPRPLDGLGLAPDGHPPRYPRSARDGAVDPAGQPPVPSRFGPGRHSSSTPARDFL